MAQRTRRPVRTDNYDGVRRTDWVDTLGRRGDIRRTPDGCWQVGDDPGKYARLHVANHEYDFAHRLVYLSIKGPIPDGYAVHHRCENKACINPDHLEAMSLSDHTSHHQRLRYSA